MSDHVGTKADQHLRSGLSADAAVQVRLAWEELAAVLLSPAIGDGIAHEHHGRSGGSRVVGAIPAQIRPILQNLCIALNLSLKLGHVRRSHFLGPAQCGEQ